jgi:hypothetical protein
MRAESYTIHTTPEMCMIDPGINSPQVNSAPLQVFFFLVRTITKIVEIGKEESGGCHIIYIVNRMKWLV